MPIQFGDFELDEERFQLRLCDRRLAIRPKVFDLLVLLVRSRERVVLRDELVLSLWGTTAVGPGSLSGLVNELRQVLGEARRETSPIRTVHARGYQFVADVEPEVGVESNAPIRSAEAIEEGAANSLGPAMMSIRASYEAAVCSGSRAALVTGASGLSWTALLEWATRALGNAGFETIRSSNPIATNDCGVALIDRLLEALVEHRGIGSLRSMIPMRSHELFERCLNDRSEGSQWSQRNTDALAARQYEGRIQRGAAELLRTLTRDQPIAFLFDAAGSTAEGVASGLPALLNRLEDARVFMLCLSSPTDSKDESGHAMPSVDSKIDWIECSGENASDWPVEDRNRLNRYLEARGMEALPRLLADALVAHLRNDEASFESIACWLSNEVGAGSANATGSTLRAGSSRMRRVEPATMTDTRTDTRTGTGVGD
jgi:DNA-binding winged helix-turn-helix (wHTH) protein